MWAQPRRARSILWWIFPLLPRGESLVSCGRGLGGRAVLSPKLKPHLAGIETADSITCDAHKWFSVPVGAGMFFCRHAGAVRDAFHADTAYMPRPVPGRSGSLHNVCPVVAAFYWSETVSYAGA